MCFPLLLSSPLPKNESPSQADNVLKQIAEFLTDESTIDAQVAQEAPAYVTNQEIAGEFRASQQEVSSISSDGGIEVANIPPHYVDEETGVTLLRMKNGVRVAHKKTPFDKQEFKVHVSMLGGRAVENRGNSDVLLEYLPDNQYRCRQSIPFQTIDFVSGNRYRCRQLVSFQIRTSCLKRYRSDIVPNKEMRGRRLTH